MATACAPASRWRQQPAPQSIEAQVLLESADPSDVMSEMFPDEVPMLPIRERLRPCCAFGADLRSKLGPIPVPFLRLRNMRGAEDVGAHTYDSGVLMLRYGDTPELLLNEENNGLVYTCRGGFIDTAHVRDYADWTFYLSTEIGRQLGRAFELDLGDEGGERRIVFEALSPEVVEAVGLRRITVALAARLAFQMSIYHEIATSFGWAAVPGFTERASAFSPEDLYSNLLGVKLASAVIYRRTGASEAIYNEAVGFWLDRVLGYLQAVPSDLGMEALDQLDGLWWDSTKRLPDPSLVLRRNFEMDAPISPWRIPDDRLTPQLREACEGAEPVRLSSPDTLDGLRLDEIARLEIEVPEEWRGQEPWTGLGSPIAARDFPELVEYLRQLILERFGPRGDQPD